MDINMSWGQDHSTQRKTLSQTVDSGEGSQAFHVRQLPPAFEQPQEERLPLPWLSEEDPALGQRFACRADRNSTCWLQSLRLSPVQRLPSPEPCFLTCVLQSLLRLGHSRVGGPCRSEDHFDLTSSASISPEQVHCHLKRLSHSASLPECPLCALRPARL